MATIPLFFNQSELGTLLALFERVKIPGVQARGVHEGILSKLKVAISAIESSASSLVSDVSVCIVGNLENK